MNCITPLRPLFIAVISLLIIVNSYSQWSYLDGPFCGEVRVIVNDSFTLYSGTNAGGIYKSTNLGSSWSYVGLNGNVVRAIAAEGNFIAAGTDDGLYISTNAGDNWTKINSISSPVRSLLKYQSTVLAGTDAGVYRSTDTGTNWVLTGLTNSSVRALHIDMNFIIYAGTSGNGIFRSSNGGASWLTSGLNTGYVRSIKSYVNVVYASMWGGVRVSSNGGSNWSSIGLDALDVPEIAVISNIMYAATWEGVYKSTNNGSNWNLLNFNESITWALLAIDNNIVLIGRDGEGIFKTTNGGMSWLPANNGLNSARVWKVHQHTNEILFAGTSGGAYKSTNSGLSWELSASSILANRFWSALTLSPNDILLGTSRGILRSTDVGSSWSLITSNEYSVKQIAKHQNGNLFAGTTTGVLRSTDNGTNWTVQNAGLINTSVTDLVIASNGNIFVSTSGGSGVYRSTNNGGSWSSLNVSSTSINALAIDRFDHLYAVSSSNIYKSTNYGNNWSIIYSANVYFSSIAIDDSGYVYLGSLNGLYLGFNFGQEWLLSPIYFPNPNVLSVNVFNDGSPFIGFAGGGIVKMISPYIPVELVTFAGELHNNNVLLKWTTASETNNRGFEIERRIDNGQLIIDNWKSIAFVNGYGNSITLKEYSFADEISNILSLNLNLSLTLNYRLKQINTDGQFIYTDIVTIDIKNIPLDFELYQNYPNPFNSNTIIKFNIPNNDIQNEKAFTSLIIYDALGKEVAILLNNDLEAGIYSIEFDANKYYLPSGLYFYCLSSKNYSETKKMIYLK